MFTLCFLLCLHDLVSDIAGVDACPEVLVFGDYCLIGCLQCFFLKSLQEHPYYTWKRFDPEILPLILIVAS